MLNIYPKLAPMAGLPGYGGGPTGLGLAGAAGYVITTNAWGDRGMSFGGYIDNVGNKGMDWMDYWEISSCGGASDFGNLVEGRANSAGGGSNVARCVFSGGYNTSSPDRKNNIDYVNPASTGNASDFGDLQSGRSGCGDAACDGRNITSPGYNGGGNSNIDYFSIASTGNASDFGDTTQTDTGSGAGGNGETWVTVLGATGSSSNGMDYVIAATTGNGTDFGDLAYPRGAAGGMTSDLNGSDRCVWTHDIYLGGYSDSMDYITMSTTGNATDFGDGTAAYRQVGGTSNNTKGQLVGGNAGCANNSGCPNYNYIRQITIATTGNASNCSGLTNSGMGQGAASGNAS